MGEYGQKKAQCYYYCAGWDVGFSFITGSKNIGLPKIPPGFKGISIAFTPLSFIQLYIFFETAIFSTVSFAFG